MTNVLTNPLSRAHDLARTLATGASPADTHRAGGAIWRFANEVADERVAAETRERRRVEAELAALRKDYAALERELVEANYREARGVRRRAV